MEFTVDRKTWLRGERISYLLNAKGKMCCLGFVCIQMSLSKDDIEERIMPHLLNKLNRKKLLGVLTREEIGSTVDLPWVATAAEINDRLNISDEQRKNTAKEKDFSRWLRYITILSSKAGMNQKWWSVFGSSAFSQQ